MQKILFLRRKKTRIFLGVFVFFLSIFFSGYQNHVYATPVTDAPHTAATIAQTKQDLGLHTKKEVKMTVGARIWDGALSALTGAVDNLIRTVAYDVGEYIGNGGQGKQPLFIEHPGKYFENISKDAAADAIGKLGEPWGLNLCQIPDIRLNVALKVGLSLQAARPQVSCSWQQLKQTYGPEGRKEWRRRYGTEEGLAERFVTDLDITQEPLGIASGASAQIGGIQATAKFNSLQEYLTGDGFKGVKDVFTGETKTPAQLVAYDARQLTPKDAKEVDASRVSSLYLSRTPSTLLSRGLATLLQSMSQTALKNFYEGLLPGPEDEEVQFDYLLDLGGAGEFADVGAEVAALNVGAENRFERFEPATPVSDYDILAQEYAVCPDTGRGVNNCVVDSRMLELLAKAAVETITIKQAIDSGLLPNKQLISSRHQIHSDRDKCWKGDYYCESNIAKLKKLRIFPLGFEIAVANADPDNPPTLKEVVDGYNDCPGAGATVDEVAQKPYCKLINPNWVIKAPFVRCQGKFFGQQAESNVIADRIEECIDVQTCIDKDPQGNCIYGYCTKEKNTWDIDADSCAQQYATCKTYRNNETRYTASYLSRSVEYGECDGDSVGCRKYAREKVGDEWTTAFGDDLGDLADRLALGRMPALYFNKKAKDIATGCGIDNNGCTAFVPALRHTTGDYVKTEQDAFVQDTRGGGELTHIKKAPDYLGCYDTNRGTLAIDYPTTVQQARNAVAQNEACNDFSAVCVEEEVGCQEFFPVSFGGLPIPGKIGPQNLCNEECVGYDTFKQVDYKELGQGFDDEVFPLHFIPRIAQENMRADGLGCVAEYAGCDEFTNLEDVSVGGGQLEHYVTLKYCEKPQAGGTNELTLFSWEGSAAEGFVLQTHLVRPMSQQDVNYIGAIFDQPADGDIINAYPFGSPRYADDRPSVLRELAETCNADTYQIKLTDPNAEGAAPADCHELFDEQNTKHYRLLSQLITVSDQCHELRKTVANTYVQEDLNEEICTQRGGKPEGDDCTRCVAGGRFDVQGTCIYSAMTGENESRTCPANANQCRAYTGNTAANVERIISDVFEPAGSEQADLDAARNGWGYIYPVVDQNNATIAAQSADIGLNSLRLSGNSDQQFMRHIATTTARFDDTATYEMTFWAQTALAQDITFALHQMNEDDNSVGGELGAFDAVQIGVMWQRYQVGPITLSNANPEVDVYLVLQKAGAGDVFIDNVELTRVQDHIYLIEDSWKTRPEQYDVPIACDSVPADALPGEALGCKAYAEGSEDGPVRFATGFDMLCREKAIGCQPLWDTHNTLDGESPELMQVYNARCESPGNPSCEITFDLNGENRSYSCQIPNGQDFCYIPGPIPTPDFDYIREYTSESTIVIPADTATSTPVFLSVHDDVSCDQGDRGCMEVGLEQQTLPPGAAISTIESSSVYVKNDPSEYGATLCIDSLVGCSEFAYSGGVSYFKDPNIVGSAICAYRERTPNSDNPYGWFVADSAVGICSGGDLDSPQYCKEDTDCVSGRTCQQIGNAPCYPDELNRDGAYGLVSNASADYRSLVGSCPDSANMCTELLDPQDTSQVHPEGKPYFVLFNSRITSRFGECGGRVNLLDGCVLLDKVEDPNKIFSAEDTYSASENTSPVPFSSVVPSFRQDATQNDTNLLLKVKRDRMCSEFLGCRTTQPVRMSDGTQRDVCYQFQACDERSTDPNATCASWVNTYTSDQDANDILSVLTKDRYVSEKDTSWYGEEYSGYSLYNSHQITSMVYRYFDIDKLKQGCGDDSLCDEYDQFYGTMFLLQKYPDSLLVNNDEPHPCVREAESGTLEAANFVQCGGGGFCYDLECLSPIHGYVATNLSGGAPSHAEKIALLKEFVGDECKAYPEIDSPFSYSVLLAPDEQLGVSSGAFVGVGPQNHRPKRARISKDTLRLTSVGGLYGAVNVCQNGSCGCAYKKVTFGNFVTDYYPLQKREKSNLLGDEIPQGVCISENSRKGKTCNRASECDSHRNEDEVAGVCQKKTKIETKYGIRGFCLQYDKGIFNEVYGEEFPCLMWLPIEVSASRVDELNSFDTAGYNPSVDAADPDAGRLYCVESFDFSDVRDNIDDGAVSPPPYPEVAEVFFHINNGRGNGYEPADIYMDISRTEQLEQAGTNREENTLDDGYDYTNTGWWWSQKQHDSRYYTWKERKCMNLWGDIKTPLLYDTREVVIGSFNNNWIKKKRTGGLLNDWAMYYTVSKEERGNWFDYEKGSSGILIPDKNPGWVSDDRPNHNSFNHMNDFMLYDLVLHQERSVEPGHRSVAALAGNVRGYDGAGNPGLRNQRGESVATIQEADYTWITEGGPYALRARYLKKGTFESDMIRGSAETFGQPGHGWEIGDIAYGFDADWENAQSSGDSEDDELVRRAMMMGDYANIMCPEWVPRKSLRAQVFKNAGPEDEGFTNRVSEYLGTTDRAIQISIIMNAWADRNIAPNAVVLRAEGPGAMITQHDVSAYNYNQPYTYGSKYHGSRGVEVQNGNIYKVGPYSGSGDHVMPLHLLASGRGGETGYGTIVYPPRTFDAINTQPSPKLGEFYFQGIDNARKIYPVFHSPGPLYEGVSSGGNLQEDRVNLYGGLSGSSDVPDYDHNPVFRSKYEAVLRDTDLSKVYFVTTKMTDGLDKQKLPQLLSNDLYIDFSSLRAAEEPGDGEERSISFSQKCFSSKEELGGPGEDEHVIAEGGHYIVNKFQRGGNDEFPIMAGEAAGNGSCVRSDNGDGSLEYKTYLQTVDIPEITSYTVDTRSNLGEYDSRHRIAKRYVLVWNHGVVPYDVDSNDPFKADCTAFDLQPSNYNDLPDARIDSWFAIGMDFNDDGEFLGYISKMCNGDKYSASPQLAVIAEVGNRCIDVAQVYSEPNANDEGLLDAWTNRAFTNRVWEGSVYRLFNTSYFGVGVANSPFGSLLEPELFQKLDTKLHVGDDENFEEYEDLFYQLSFGKEQPGKKAISLSCVPGFFGAALNPRFRGEMSCSDIFNTYFDNQQADFRFHVRTLEEAYTGLKDVFGLVFQRIVSPVKNNLRNYFTDNKPGLEVDQTIDVEDVETASQIYAPHIFSTNPATCRNTNAEGERAVGDQTRCGLGEKDNVTISGKNGIKGRDYDRSQLEYSQDSKSIIQKESFYAVMEFFYAAHDDHMPIRRIMVDWNDGLNSIVNESRWGMYRNRKPVCSDAAVKRCRVGNGGQQLTELMTCGNVNDCPVVVGLDAADQSGVYSCVENEERMFGDQERACDEGPIRFTHEYTCGLGDILSNQPYVETVSAVQSLDQDAYNKLITMNLVGTDKVCVFQPKVQVLDNWEWCNGVAQEGGSYEGYYGIKENTEENGCDPTENPDAFTPYKGYVIVIPSLNEEEEG